MGQDSSIALLTFVLQPHHVAVVEDWIDFFDHGLAELIVHVGADPGIVESLELLCSRRKLALQVLGTVTAKETTADELSLLYLQFAAVRSDLACMVRLDTLPYRRPGLRWQDDALAAMRKIDAPFVTGAAKPFRADVALPDPRFLRTQRVSNCFIILSPAFWRTGQGDRTDAEQRFGRFSSEGSIEDYLVATNTWGLRCVNSRDFRVFHCQEWGPRLLKVRQAFKAGHRISPFLRGYQDDVMGARETFYLHPRPPLIKRLRIWLGAQRRKLIG
jgi:hypothetical protein